MAAEYPEITESNREVLEHILVDLHSALKLLRDQGVVQERHDLLLRKYEPLLEQFSNPTAMTMLAARRARRNSG